MSQKLGVDRLYRRMEIAGVTASQLAEKAGISRQAMYNILNEKSQPRPETMERICSALDCNPAALYGRTQWDAFDDHDRFAGVVVARYDREGEDYDVEGAIIEYVRNWLEEHYSDLDRKQFETVRATADEQARDHAGNVHDVLMCFHRLFVSDETQAKALAESFTSFFEALPLLIENELPIDMDFEIFDIKDEEAAAGQAS